MKVRAAVAREGQRLLSIEDLDLSDPGPDGILVRIVSVGLCHTDVKTLQGEMAVPKPVVLGHEGAGIVERTGERVTKVKPGDPVVLTFDSCGTCRPCTTGNPAYCAQNMALNFRDAREGAPGSFRDGSEAIHGHFFGQSSFANYAVTTSRNTIPVRKDSPLEILGVLGCGIQTGAGAVMNSLQPPPGSSIAIFGVGPVGLSAVMGAVIGGCTEIIAIDVLEPRLEIAKQLGATRVVRATRKLNAAEEIWRAVPGGVNYALDTTGRAATFDQAIASLATKGFFGFVTAPAGSPGLNLSAVMIGGQSVRGIVQGDSAPDAFIPHLIELHMSGRFPFDKLITKYPFEQVNQAIADQTSGKVVKPVFTFPH